MKMSDVFKLPVSPSLMGDDHIEQLTDCGGAHYCLEDSAYWMASNLEHIEHAAHAINHADALADALELMIKSNWGAASEKRASQVVAGAALAAYRGAK